MTETSPITPDPPRSYSHRPEAPFETNLANWFRARYGKRNVEQQYYFPDVRWFCDIVVTFPWGTLYIETESRSSEVRSGMAQALGYAAGDPSRGVPMVVAPKDHLPSKERMDRLRTSTTVLFREFDAEKGVFTGP